MSASGDWQVTVNSPMGVQKGTLTLEANGAVLSGKVVIPQGSESFANGKISGSHLTWNIKMSKPMPMELQFSAVVDGDDISGKVKLGMFGDASFAGTRV
jgi:hypothetical protein